MLLCDENMVEYEVTFGKKYVCSVVYVFDVSKWPGIYTWSNWNVFLTLIKLLMSKNCLNVVSCVILSAQKYPCTLHTSTLNCIAADKIRCIPLMQCNVTQSRLPLRLPRHSMQAANNMFRLNSLLHTQYMTRITENKTTVTTYSYCKNVFCHVWRINVPFHCP